MVWRVGVTIELSVTSGSGVTSGCDSSAYSLQYSHRVLNECCFGFTPLSHRYFLSNRESSD